MYAAGALNAHNPWFIVMPDLAMYLQRVSFALRLGKPANDVAVLLPNDDVWASFRARMQQKKPATSLGGFDETGSNVSIDESMPEFLGKQIIPQILDAGFNFDFIDADAIDRVGIPYKVLILPGIDRLSPETYGEIAEFAQHGGIVIATRRLPNTAPGYEDAARISAQVRQISELLFRSHNAPGHFVEDEHSLGTTLSRLLPPDFVTDPPTPQIGFIHRHLESGDLYFIANTSNRRHTVQAQFRAAGAYGEEWEPFNGEIRGIRDPKQHVELKLEPYESRLLFFSNAPLAPASTPPQDPLSRIDISENWQFAAGKVSTDLTVLTSWTKDARLRFYSGTAAYTKAVQVPASFMRPGKRIFLDFGEGTRVPIPDPNPRPNMRAYLESPVREAAMVYVNDRFAGYVWHPPYRVELSNLLRPGANEFRIVVGNTAINELSGQSLPDYRLLYSRYGVEFIPQGMESLKPLPSGILGSMSLIAGDSR